MILQVVECLCFTISYIERFCLRGLRKDECSNCSHEKNLEFHSISSTTPSKMSWIVSRLQWQRMQSWYSLVSVKRFLNILSGFEVICTVGITWHATASLKIHRYSVEHPKPGIRWFTIFIWLPLQICRDRGHMTWHIIPQLLYDSQSDYAKTVLIEQNMHQCFSANKLYWIWSKIMHDLLNII